MPKAIKNDASARILMRLRQAENNLTE